MGVMSTIDFRAHQLVLDHLETAILTGELPVGTQLPPERDLATQLGVSRGAVREAIRELRAQGIVESLPGPGRGTRITSGQTAAMSRMFRLHLAIATTSLSDLCVARIALEGATAALAATHWTAATLSEQERLINEMEETTDLPTFNQLDTQFHVSITVAAQNPLIGDLTAAIREAMREPILRASESMEDWQAFRLELVKQHRAIFDAIARRDGRLATQLMEEHIRFAWEGLKLEEQNDPEVA